MPYTVTASNEVHDQLAQIWIEAPDPKAVSAASNLIDHILRTAPLTWGAVQGDQRVLTIDPLTVLYTVSPNDRLVEIVRYTYTGWPGSTSVP